MYCQLCKKDIYAEFNGVAICDDCVQKHGITYMQYQELENLRCENAELKAKIAKLETEPEPVSYMSQDFVNIPTPEVKKILDRIKLLEKRVGNILKHQRYTIACEDIINKEDE